MKLLPSSLAMRVPLSLRPPDMYNPLQVFLHEACPQEFAVLVCGSIVQQSGFELFDTYI